VQKNGSYDEYAQAAGALLARKKQFGTVDSAAHKKTLLPGGSLRIIPPSSDREQAIHPVSPPPSSLVWI
jgi:hypothetical protein